MEVSPMKGRRFAHHVLRDSMQVTIRLIVKSARLVTTVAEVYNQRVTLEPFPLQELGIVLPAVVDTSVMVINE